ncbi:hypothetical protein GCM10009819_07580 [Agromyces tropicus]|uniref:EthD family reductase n=1 Tax=Agromyces tropicus TaxID=555371 RepID=A0ABP5FJP0_9MICO
MYDLLISAPAATGVDREHFERLYASVHSSLVACIPGLVRSRQSAAVGADGTAGGACVLRFRTAKAASLAMLSREWVDLIDETTDLISWDDATLASGPDVPQGVWEPTEMDHRASAAAAVAAA